MITTGELLKGGAGLNESGRIEVTPGQKNEARTEMQVEKLRDAFTPEQIGMLKFIIDEYQMTDRKSKVTDTPQMKEVISVINRLKQERPEKTNQ